MNPEVMAEMDDDGEPREEGESTQLALVRGEIESQIATARRFPRNIRKAMDSMVKEATMDRETAAACRYAVPRQGKIIEGPSIRFAEIVARSWGNMRWGSRMVGEDSRFLTTQAVAHDLESNLAVQVEVRTRITKRDGDRYSEDMIQTAGQASSGIALRNAVLKAVPKTYWAPAFAAAAKVTQDDGKPLRDRQAAVAEFFKRKYGVKPDRLCALVGKTAIEELTSEDIATYQAIRQAIEDGDTTATEAFPGDTPSQHDLAKMAATPQRPAGARPPGRPRLTEDERARRYQQRAERNQAATRGPPEPAPGVGAEAPDPEFSEGAPGDEQP
jgi:hypothetical protein